MTFISIYIGKLVLSLFVGFSLGLALRTTRQIAEKI